ARRSHSFSARLPRFLSADDEVEPDRSLQRGACRVQRDSPGLVSDDSVLSHATPLLKRDYRGLRLRAKLTVDCAGRHAHSAAPVESTRCRLLTTSPVDP